MLFATLFAIVFIALCFFVTDLSTSTNSNIDYDCVTDYECEVAADYDAIARDEEWERVQAKYQEVLDWEESWSDTVDAAVWCDSTVSTLEDVIVYLMPNAVELVADELMALPDRRFNADEWHWVEPASLEDSMLVGAYRWKCQERAERALVVYEEDGYSWVA